MPYMNRKPRWCRFWKTMFYLSFQPIFNHKLKNAPFLAKRIFFRIQLLHVLTISNQVVILYKSVDYSRTVFWAFFQRYVSKRSNWHRSLRFCWHTALTLLFGSNKKKFNISLPYGHTGLSKQQGTRQWWKHHVFVKLFLPLKSYS